MTSEVFGIGGCKEVKSSMFCAQQCCEREHQMKGCVTDARPHETIATCATVETDWWTVWSSKSLSCIDLSLTSYSLKVPHPCDCVVLLVAPHLLCGQTTQHVTWHLLLSLAIVCWFSTDIAQHGDYGVHWYVADLLPLCAYDSKATACHTSEVSGEFAVFQHMKHARQSACWNRKDPRYRGCQQSTFNWPWFAERFSSESTTWKWIVNDVECMTGVYDRASFTTWLIIGSNVTVTVFAPKKDIFSIYWDFRTHIH